ncbi:MAG: isovaleryl-CoA dehydrogenase [Betaproteobacteria bacterium]|nr:isovaleryl-CoA dehydrogenase [Betaproteobacteria bacterium]
MTDRFATHEVTNQPPAFAAVNFYATDRALQEGVAHFGGAWAEDALHTYGALAGGEMMALGIAANENKPRFKPFDRQGHRIDQVEFHPAYHRLMALGVEHGVSNFTWRHAGREGANVARAALMYLHTQADQGTSCPLTMTYASVPALRRIDGIASQWLPRILSTSYDERFLPAQDKRGATLGMGMTEKQGGSDVRANTTRALPLARTGPGEWYELVGHKWFFSAPMCDAFLVLAQAQAGLSCFLLPRFRPDGSVNALRLQRLKDKLGDWSNASSEVEFHGAHAQLVGDEGRGVATILDMVALTRQDCMIGSSGIMRQALVQAIHHARHRTAFGKRLVDQPLMQNVLADLALESEAALALTLRVARAVDRAPYDAQEAAFARVATAIGKYWVCKRCPPFVNEAQECLGGAGYVEESILPRLYRQAPLNSIWEGSGNIQCLDVLRALAREPACRDALFAEFATCKGESRLLDECAGALAAELLDTANLEAQSRALVERMAIALQGTQLIRVGHGKLAHAFIEARLGQARRNTFGAMAGALDGNDVIEWAFAG